MRPTPSPLTFADAGSMRHQHSAGVTRLLRVIRAAAVVTATGCASAPTPIQLAGRPEALAALVGNWSGEYTGFESKRSGTITFSLREGDTTAFGDVLMIPNGYEQHDVWNDYERHRKVAPRHPQVVTIMFVGIASQRVTGMLDPYTDPECSCTVVTTFIGRLTSPSALQGTFVTRTPGTPRIQTGTWQAVRNSGAR